MACELGQVPRIWAPGSACEVSGGVQPPPSTPGTPSLALQRIRAPPECWQLRRSDPGQKRGPRRGTEAHVENREAGARLNAQRTVLDSKTEETFKRAVCGWISAQRASGRGPGRTRLWAGPGAAGPGRKAAYCREGAGRCQAPASPWAPPRAPPF